MDYQDFIEQKRIKVIPSGFEVEKSNINPMMFDFQNDLTRWALRRGKAELFEECGMGKTVQMLEWGKHVCEETKGNVIIFAPLAVSAQTKREGEKFEIDMNICRTGKDVKPGINMVSEIV